ncbi:MAG: radical SAM protein [Bacteroidota bacterium]|nr:7-carboxy-7-deazaguanine synthase QueE [Candidatus Kapabacteria bacterium]MCX7936463.1 7-carboxy-7-deazaguanine synthase QueE [Chlorobiota bacterium]MDW8271267.1 radical SAM protein [Bacteroidota bacterium]
MAKFTQPTREALAGVPNDPNQVVLSLSEIFHSIQGEGTRAGMPCVFVRLQGCSLRCVWCDTPYALDRRKPELVLSAADILQRIEHYGTPFVELTGGEPLEQLGTFRLVEWLCDRGYTVAIETGGHISIEHVDPRAICIVDVKCPDSRMQPLNYAANLDFLRPHDEVKFVIASRRDYEWARTVVEKHNLSTRAAAVLFSPAFGIIQPDVLAEWILSDRLPVRLQLQLHKFIWEPHRRGV